MDLILSSGGTGFTPDDVTPEAVEQLLTKRADSLTHYMQSEALKITPMACLSRAVIGVIEAKTKSCMVVTLPGKPKAVHENFACLIQNRILTHALAQMKNRERT